MTQAGDLRLVRGGLIRGRVIDVADGRPVRLARAMNWADAVMLYGPSRPAGGAVESVMIQPDGSFEIRAAPRLNHLYVNGARNDPRCPHRSHGRHGPAATQDHEIVGIVDGAGLESGLVSQGFPAQHESPRRQPTHQTVGEGQRRGGSKRPGHSAVPPG